MPGTRGVKQQVVAQGKVRNGLLQVGRRARCERLDEVEPVAPQFEAQLRAFGAMQLHVVEAQGFGTCGYGVEAGVDEYADAFGVAGQIGGCVRHEAGRAFVADEPYPVGSGIFYGADVFGLAHAAYFDYHVVCCLGTTDYTDLVK